MMTTSWVETACRRVLAAMALLVPLAAAAQTSAPVIPDTPLSVQQPVKPMVMLVASKDHRLFYEAYNDASDIDGDGRIDTRFKPSNVYLGLFNSDYCYSHNGNADNTGLFTPVSLATQPERRCPGQWSGNWLNYVSTSRIDALRVVLYGGMREVDEPSRTVLRRAYIPQDAHSWAKEYTSASVDGYLISDYTPLSQPSAQRRHFFGNLTPNFRTNCSTLNNCSNMAPWLAVVTNSASRVWNWAAKGAPVLDESHGGARTNYAVRVLACPAGFDAGCREYPSGSRKPAGLLHEYGESEAMLFGLLTGSYDNNMAGGRLRKVVSSFRDEVNQRTGQFTAAARIVKTFDALRIRDFNNGNTGGEYRGGWLTTGAPAAGAFPDWGNPIGEMMYESLRYFAGRARPTAAYSGASTLDQSVGLSEAAWDDPFGSTSLAKAPYCARSNMLVISDVNVSYDSDHLPGSSFSSGIAGDLPNFNASAEAQMITDNEPDVRGLHFIGQAGGASDFAPTAKMVDSLGNMRGLAPEEPTKEGSYYAAAVAAFGKRSDLRADQTGQQRVDTFVVALASPLPRIEVPMQGDRKITLVPFAKSVYGEGAYFIRNTKGGFQPTNQIVDFIVEEVVNSGPGDANPNVNGGRYRAKFRINFEDVEQGADHDMDVIVEYLVEKTSDNSIAVTLRPIEQAGSIQHRIGYVISGTDADGVYLEVQDELAERNGRPFEVPYFLNTPAGRKPGFCDQAPLPPDCLTLPYTRGDGSLRGIRDTATRTFTVGTRPAATLLKDPLWYAAKWGGFIDRNENGKPDLDAEWALNRPGVPDNYSLVVNPTRLRDELRNAFESIASRTSSASNVSINSTEVNGDSMVFQATFNSRNWSGDLIARAITRTGLGPTPAWQASLAMPPWQDRNIFVRTTQRSTTKLNVYTDLPEPDRSLLGSDAIHKYLRGDRTNEIRNGGRLRDRGAVIGDIVHSSPYYDGLTKTLYVGANDGMLHAFKADTGTELFAFMPRAAMVPKGANRPAPLPLLADPGYTHAYFVDGDMIVAPTTSGAGEQRYLYALMGQGGRGLFSLNVTSPNNFSANNFLWEYTPAGAGVDPNDPTRAAATDLNLGFMLGRPVVTRLNTGQLGLIAGNGYNSPSGKAALYIFIINADGSLASVQTLDTGAADNNGLSGPVVMDTNNDGKGDVVFAGDLKGNVWKFDIGAINPQAWRVAHGGRPMFTATDADGKAQPITAPMFVAYKPGKPTKADPHAGRLFVFFGTGAYFRVGDTTSSSIQSWWGLLGDTPNPIPGRAALRGRGVDEVGTTSRGRSARTFKLATAGDMADASGWYIDFTAPRAGERIITASKIVQIGVPVLMASSFYPVTDSPCEPGGRGFLNVVDPFTGGGIGAGVLDADRNGSTDNDVLEGGTRFIGSVDLGIGMPTEARVITDGSDAVQIIVGGSGGQDGTVGTVDGKQPPPSLRPVTYRGRLSWREIVKE